MFSEFYWKQDRRGWWVCYWEADDSVLCFCLTEKQKRAVSRILEAY